tara:strand:- start:612 stop:1106 length:495 start_codon:yes stop_codon:yes gene_type:complete
MTNSFGELNEFEVSASERYDAFLTRYPLISEEQKEAVRILCNTQLPLGHIENVVFFHQYDFASDLLSYAKELAWYLSTKEWFSKNLFVVHETFESVFAEAKTLLSTDVSKDFERSYDTVSDLFKSILHQALLNRPTTSDFVICGYEGWRHDFGFEWVIPDSLKD